MCVVLLVLGAIFIAFAYPMFKYKNEGSPEKQREEEAYNQLMDYLKAEASEHTGREITEEDILSAGRRYNRSRKRF